jgi:Holliday junction resolvase-like predicted endonuclease
MNDANRNKRLLRDDIINPIEVGQAFEEQAKIFLENNGYTINRWYSKENWGSPCDMLVEKNGIEMYCEVRGLNGDRSAYTFTGQKMDTLTVLSEHKPVIFVLIRKNKCKVVSINDLPMERYVSYPKRRSAPNYYQIVERFSIKQHQPTTTVKAFLDNELWNEWKIFKKSVGGTNATALVKLIDHYNREKGRKLI